MTLTTTELSTIGTKNTLRSPLYSQPRRSSSTAIPRPSTFGTITTITVSIVVTRSDARKSLSVSSSR
jgi:hypothetical protein